MDTHSKNKNSMNGSFEPDYAEKLEREYDDIVRKKAFYDWLFKHRDFFYSIYNSNHPHRPLDKDEIPDGFISLTKLRRSGNGMDYGWYVTRIKNNTIPSIKIGHRWYIDKEVALKLTALDRNK